MRILGLDITRQKSVPATAQALAPTDRGWWSLIREPFTGAWQRNMELRSETVVQHHAVNACLRILSSDISKTQILLKQKDPVTGLWSEVVDTSPYYIPLRKPNRWQHRGQFFEQWMLSKLIHGNTYALLERDGRGIVAAMYILDPIKTKPLVAPDGSIFYNLSRDNLAGLEEDRLVVPASEIIHDRMTPTFHPLVGVSPLASCGLAAAQGMNIQKNATKFFANGAKPYGVLTAPGKISDDTARRLKAEWAENYSGDNVGHVAALGDGLTYQPLTINAVDSQLIEQLRWVAESICSSFGVPVHKICLGQMPNYNNIEALDQQYYSQCLQKHIEDIELCLDEGLGLYNLPGRIYGTEFDLDGLIRMDTTKKIDAAAKATAAGFMTLDEARAKFDLVPTPGGDVCYLQEQYYSTAAHARRDALPDPFAKGKTAPQAAAPSTDASQSDPSQSDPVANDNAAAARAAVARSWKRHSADARH